MPSLSSPVPEPGALARPSDDVSTGLTSDRWFDHGLSGREITWIAWDSGFRRTDLRVGDVVLAMNGVSCDVRRGEMAEDAMVGAFGEPGGWKKAGRAGGDTVRLSVWRDHERFEVEAPLVPRMFYYDGQGRPALGPGGPPRHGGDGGRSWSGWYEDLTRKLSLVLCHGWRRNSFNSRQELRDLLDFEPRVRQLVEEYPGPFAEVVSADLQAGIACARGRQWSDAEIDVGWREEAARAAGRVQEAAGDAERRFQAAIESRLSSAQPAPDPVDNDPEAFAGKVVRLDRVSPRSMRMDAGHPWYVLGDSRSGYWFMDAQSDGCRKFHEAYERYRQLVDRSVHETYRFYAEILPVPRMMVVDGHPAAGLTLSLLAGVVGDRVFAAAIDTAGVTAGCFAGEALLEAGAPLPDAASPRQVVEAAIQALKVGRQPAWKALFADWHVSYDWNGALSYTPVSVIPDTSIYYEWDFGRGALAKDVYDVKVVREGAIETVLAPDAPGAVHIEECRIEVEHVGRFDDEYRSFKGMRHHRTWTLQRRDGGPWRLRDLHAL